MNKFENIEKNYKIFKMNLSDDDGYHDETHIWYDKPTGPGMIVIGVVVPIINGVGVIFNIINVIIYLRTSMCGSTYSYLMGI